MRKIRRKERKKQKKILIIGSLSLLLFLCIGYAAFSTSLSLKAKGNIKYKKASDMLMDKVVSSGDGLYKDIYSSDRYVYKGLNPNNYIYFNDELWRIISIESDKTLKIISNESIGNMKYDEPGSRSSTTNTGTYCTLDNGCNAYGITNDFGGAGTVLKDSTLNIYLNGEYYNSINENYKKYIVTHDFANGFCGSSGTIDNKNYINEAMENEQKIIWHGNIGLMNLTDFLNATTDKNCDSVYSGWHDGYPCHNNNYLFKDNEIITTMSTSSVSQDHLWNINNIKNTGGICSAGNECGYTYLKQEIYPVIYLNNEIVILGEGTEENPYILN